MRARGAGARRGPMLIEGELVARSTGAASGFAPAPASSTQKFGPGTVAAVDGNKLTVEFDRAGRKMVLDSLWKLCLAPVSLWDRRCPFTGA